MSKRHKSAHERRKHAPRWGGARPGETEPETATTSATTSAATTATNAALKHAALEHADDVAHHREGPVTLESFGELSSTLAADEEAEVRYRRAVPQGEEVSWLLPISRKVALTALVLVALVALPYAHPALAEVNIAGRRFSLRLFSGEDVKPLPGLELADDGPPPEARAPMPAASVGEAAVPGETDNQEARAKELDAPLPDARGPIAQARKETTKYIPKNDQKAPRSMEDPTGHGLDKFFAKLAKVEDGEAGAVARILYYGDSIVASDFVTGKLRRMLQDRFGDAGHGYALVANAWPGWFHIDVAREASGQWSKSTCVGPYAEDGIYGLGCASFTARAPKLWTRFGTAKLEKWGNNVSRFEIEYLEQPGGGAVELVVDGEAKGELDTEGPAAKLAYRTVEVPDGPHTLELRTLSDKPTRLFGIRMERDATGVTLSALGITGARARFIDKQDDAALAAALKASKADLVVLAFGSNEITDGTAYPMDDYEKTLVALMHQFEAALPDASFLLVGPPDMASNDPAQGHSKPMGGIITMRQRSISKKTGWAFWSQLDCMGGGGSMWGWIQQGLGSTDMFHPTGQGGSVLGRWLYAGMMEAYEKYRTQ